MRLHGRSPKHRDLTVARDYLQLFQEFFIMVLFTFEMRCWLAAAALGAMLGSAAYAQPTAVTPPLVSPVSATTAPASEKSVASASAFNGYKPYTDEPLGNWKAANDNVAQIGGWREYAKQAQQPDDTPAPTNKAGENIPKAAEVPTTKGKP